MAKTFVLNDETKVNSYGFRILNAGIDLNRFKDNPVMLNDHWNNTYYVLGAWENIRVEGSRLLADSRFDIDDKQAKDVAGKVERGFIKSCSMGILFDPAKMQPELSGTYLLNACELMEASIVAVPSNAHSVTLYAKDTQKMMQDDEVKMCLAAVKDYEPFLNSEKNNMKKIILSMAALTALGLVDHNTNEGVDATLVEKSVNKLKTDLDAATADASAKETALKAANDALKKLKDAEAAKLKTDAEAEVQKAIDEGRIDAPKKDSWVELMLSNLALAKATLDAIPAKKSLSAMVNNPAAGAATDEMTEEKFEKLTEAEQLSWKAENPDAYKKLFAA